VRSIPDNNYIVAFENAAKIWEKIIGISIKETKNKNIADFIIRSANEDEETEGADYLIKSFFWSKNVKTLSIVIWKGISSWENKEILFLHALGHIFGFRHEHPYFPVEERTGKAIEIKDELILYDPNSIMSSTCLINNKNTTYCDLSEDDKKEAAFLYPQNLTSQK